MKHFCFFLPSNLSGLKVFSTILLCGVLICSHAFVSAQSLLIDNSSAKQRLFTATGTLDASTLNYARNPMAIGFDSLHSNGTFAKKILLSWFINVDNGGYEPMHKRMTSLTSGATWGPFSGGTSTNNVHLGTALKLRNGKVLAIEFKPTYLQPSGNLTYPFEYYTSVNNGDSWTRHTDGVVDFSPLAVNGMRFYKGIIEEPDGSLYANAYVSYTPGASNPVRTYLLKSTDQGKTWRPMPSTSSPLPVSSNTDESTLARCVDGSWLMVMRQSTVGSPLLYSRSTNKGISWSSASTLPGLGTIIKSVDPKLMLLPNGVMVLSYGRPDQHLAFSMDGNGDNWTNAITTYTDADEVHATSANSAIVATAHNKLLQFGDYYAMTSNPNTQGIWQKEIGVRRSNLMNRIDLKTKYMNSNITVSTDMNYSATNHPEARTAGAFDGSIDYWSGAFKMATSGSYTIDLQQAKTYNTIGICLANGLLQSATVKYSLDNVSYTTLKSYSSVRHYAVDYTVTGNFTARYIKIEINSAQPIVGINEIQLFSPASTFEEDETVTVPYGYSVLNTGFWVSDGVGPLPTGYQSAQALYMDDADGNDKVISKTGFTPHTTKTLEFQLRTKAFASSGGAIQWRINSGSTIAFQLRVVSGGAVSYYNGSSYQTITGATIPLDTWTKIKVVANASGSGSISINGGAPLPIQKRSTFTGNSLDGFAFGSGGMAAIGDKSLFDDVDFYGLTPGNQTSSIPQSPEVMSSQLLATDETVNLPTYGNRVHKISVSPNPSAENVILSIKNALNGIISVSFWDLYQKKVKTLQLRVINSSLDLDIPIQDLQPGMYIITAEQNNRVAYTKLIKKSL